MNKLQYNMFPGFRHANMMGLFLMAVVLLAALSSAACRAEEITLTTYYPSPYGVYSEMRLYPKAPPPVATSCDDKQEGLMYYDNVAHALMVCRCKDSTCLFASNYAWTSAAGYWTLSTSGTDLYTNNLSWNVGIGTAEAGHRLHVYSTTDPSVQPALILVDNYQDGSGDEVSGIGFRAGNTPAAGVKTAIAQARENQPWGRGALVFLQRNTADGTSVTMSNEVMRITPAGSVGIGTTNPGAKLEVAGQVKVTGGAPVAGKVLTSDATGLATWESPEGGVPSGAVIFFNLATCPSGWTELSSARGRYLVGLPAGGTLAGTAGTALGDLENRPVGQHMHGVNDPGHKHQNNLAVSGPNSNCNGCVHVYQDLGRIQLDDITTTNSAGISINNAGSVAGTNAPYLQLLVCQKN
jgi:hypothetical protein